MHRMVLIFVAALACTSCEEIQHQACVQKLSKHFSAAQGLNSAPSDVPQMRSLLAQLGGLVNTADTTGCNSQTVYAVAEVRASVVDLQTAISNEQMLVHGLFSLFGGGDSSPLSQQANAAKIRFEAGIQLLKSEGVTGLD